MTPVVRHGMGHRLAADRDRFVATRTPPAIDIQIAHRCEAHDGTRVRRHVDGACPLTHQAQTAEVREQLQDRGYSSLRAGQTAALAEGVVYVRSATDHDLAAITLTDMRVD